MKVFFWCLTISFITAGIATLVEKMWGFNKEFFMLTLIVHQGMIAENKLIDLKGE